MSYGPYRGIAHAVVRGFTALYVVLLGVAQRLGPRRRPGPAGPREVLLTGTFHSANWVRSHLAPLARSSMCARVRMVATSPVPPIDKVEALYPPPWLSRVMGAVPARLVTFVWVALSTQPDVVGGFHLLINGLVALLVARVRGAHALYLCVGGPAEMVDGGLQSENRLFGRMGTPDALVERRLLWAASRFDLIVAMGSDTVTFMRERGVSAPVHLVPGGIDQRAFSPPTRAPITDLLFVGRLAPIKRPDLFLRSVEMARRTLPGLGATLLGDGPLRPELEALARQLGIEGSVTFAGHQPAVEDWLRRARLFVLTSDSEGLSLALMEALSCGLPVVASRVGGLSDLVEEGINGYLVAERSPEAFASRIVAVLGDEGLRRRLAEGARLSVRPFEVGAMAERWDRILGGLASGPAVAVGAA